jgi:hypothetical protein
LLAFSPSQPKQSRLAHRLAVELNCLSQGHSQHAASPGAAATGGNGAQYDTGDEEDDAQGTAGGSQGTAGGRPQRMRKPKQYLGEPTGTPRGGPRGGSLPGTPGSSTRRKVGDRVACLRKDSAVCVCVSADGVALKAVCTLNYVFSAAVCNSLAHALFTKVTAPST